MTGQALRAAVIGMGGFAREHHRALRALEEAGACRVAAACDPQIEALAPEVERLDFARRGVRVFDDYRQMLDLCRDALEVVTVPTPVPLHAPMHRACVERGLACYLEKPPTLDPAELEAMIATDSGAAKETQVGFNFIVEAARQALKQRLLDGEFGAIRRISFRGLWPRATTYFIRAAWAGRLTLDGRLVLDSCLGNAMAHYLHNLHFWAGQGELFSWEGVTGLEAELYRAHAIQGTDTVLARGVCPGGAEIRVAATHACAGDARHWERVECERATLTYLTGDMWRIVWHDGREETGAADRGDLLQENFRAYFRYLRGEEARPLTRLTDARPFVQFNGLLYVAAGRITTVAPPHVARSSVPGAEGEYVAINGIEEACDAFLQTGAFPSQQGVAWAAAGGSAAVSDLPRLPGVVARLASEAPIP